MSPQAGSCGRDRAGGDGKDPRVDSADSWTWPSPASPDSEERRPATWGPRPSMPRPRGSAVPASRSRPGRPPRRRKVSGSRDSPCWHPTRPLGGFLYFTRSPLRPAARGRATSPGRSSSSWEMHTDLAGAASRTLDRDLRRKRGTQARDQIDHSDPSTRRAFPPVLTIVTSSSARGP